MNNFDTAIEMVLKHEGGYVDNPADRGGPTNFGVSTPVLEAYLSEQKTPWYTVEHLTVETARDIYKKNYWDSLGLDAIGDTCLASICLDLAVLRGVPSLVRAIQVGCLVWPLDGIMGPSTRTAFLALATQNPQKLSLGLVLHCQALCADFVTKNPGQLQFLNGWILRTQDLIRMIQE